MLNCLLIRPKQPPSINSFNTQKRRRFATELQAAFKVFHGDAATRLSGNLYGIIYYFHREVKKGNQVDADNISKPVWDSLKDVIYADDAQIKLRIAGTYDLTENYYENLNVRNLSQRIQDELNEAFENEGHILYIECGSLEDKMYQFNLKS